MSLRTSLTTLRRALPIIGVGLVVIVVGTILGVSFYLRGRAIMEMELKDKLRTTAAMAALQFDASVIDALHSPEMEAASTEYADTVARLRSIREAGTNIRYAYLMRRTDDPDVLTFVADADALSELPELDRNQNGVLDPEEEPSFFGDEYDVAEIPALRNEAFLHPAVDEDITVDPWGELISGYAPIRRADGSVAAVLGIDMVADEYRTLSQSIFSPVALLLVLLVVGATGGYIAINIWRRRQEMLQRIAEERTGLMRLTFHQLGTPLTIVKWSLEQLKDAESEGKLKGALVDHYVALEDAIARMNGILQELKEADLVAENALQYKPQTCIVGDIVDDALLGVRHRLDQRKHVLTVEGERETKVAIDHTLISAVLQELIDNAMHYSEPGSPLHIRLRKIDGFMEVAVIDKGTGMSQRDLRRIFERFVRGSNAAHMYPDGTGLGLYIAKGIVERAGGTMRAESQEGSGSTISFTLPLA